MLKLAISSSVPLLQTCFDILLSQGCEMCIYVCSLFIWCTCVAEICILTKICILTRVDVFVVCLYGTCIGYMVHVCGRDMYYHKGGCVYCVYMVHAWGVWYTYVAEILNWWGNDQTDWEMTKLTGKWLNRMGSELIKYKVLIFLTFYSWIILTYLLAFSRCLLREVTINLGGSTESSPIILRYLFWEVTINLWSCTEISPGILLCL